MPKLTADNADAERDLAMLNALNEMAARQEPPAAAISLVLAEFGFTWNEQTKRFEDK